jgi:hypothetical protein
MSTIQLQKVVDEVNKSTKAHTDFNKTFKAKYDEYLSSKCSLKALEIIEDIKEKAKPYTVKLPEGTTVGFDKISFDSYKEQFDRFKFGVDWIVDYDVADNFVAVFDKAAVPMFKGPVAGDHVWIREHRPSADYFRNKLKPYDRYTSVLGSELYPEFKETVARIVNILRTTSVKQIFGGWHGKKDEFCLVGAILHEMFGWDGKSDSNWEYTRKLEKLIPEKLVGEMITMNDDGNMTFSEAADLLESVFLK